MILRRSDDEDSDDLAVTRKTVANVTRAPNESSFRNGSKKNDKKKKRKKKRRQQQEESIEMGSMRSNRQQQQPGDNINETGGGGGDHQGRWQDESIVEEVLVREE